MKVVFICGAGMMSGKEVMTLALLNGLRQRGHDCYCITSSWGTHLFSDKLDKAGVSYWRLRMGFITKSFQWAAVRMSIHQLLYVPGLLWGYKQLMRTLKPDVVVHTNFHHLFLLFPVLSGRNLYWSHEVIPRTNFYQKLFVLFARKVDLFIGVSSAVGDSLNQLVSNRKVIIIRNGIEIPRDSPSQPSTARRQLAIVGQVSAHKGHDLLVKALRLVANAEPDVRLRIVGSGEAAYVNMLKQQVESLGLASNVEWTGYLNEKADIYQGVDAVIVPSVFPDPYPTAIIEAGFFGIPVIASDVGGIPEMIVEGVNGFLFKNGDANSLAEMLVPLLKKPELSKLRETSRTFALTTFAVDKFVAEFESVALSKIRRDKLVDGEFEK